MPGIAIVGIHRGGTSAVAGVLHGLGAYMGDDLLPASKYNPKGYYEDQSIVDLNNEIIGDWRAPVLNRSYVFTDRYREVLKPFREHDLWAVKDPRLCYTLPVLLNAAPETQVYLVYRDLMYATKSLASREQESMSIDQAFATSARYYQKWIDILVHENVTRVIRYIDLVMYPNHVIKLVAGDLGVDITPEARNAVDGNLAHWELEEAIALVKNRGMAESG